MLDAHRKSLRRGEYNQESIEDLPLADPGDDPATQLDQQQRVDRLLAAVAQLGERCRALFKWKLEGNSFPEIQKIMGKTRSTRSTPGNRRCRKQLLSLMGDTGNDLSVLKSIASPLTALPLTASVNNV